MHARGRLIISVVVAAVLLPVASAAAAQPAVGLGTAGSYAVLGGSAVTNTGPSVLNGDLGVSPSASITGFPPGTVNGATHAADAAALKAQSDLTTSYDDAAGRTPPLAVSGDLGGLTMTGGVYRSASTIGLTGTLTLDGQGNADSVFIFQAGSSLITATSSRVVLTNGAQSCNVFWQVGSSATLGTSSTFTGSILALTSVTANSGVTINGRLLARNGAVTLDNDLVSPTPCAAPAGTGGGGTGGTGGGTGGTGGGTVGTGGGTGGTGGGTGGTGGTGGGGVVAGTSTGTSVLTTGPDTVTRQIARYGTSRCVDRRFWTLVRGIAIRQVVFSVDGRVLVTRRTAPFMAVIGEGSGLRTVSARVTFTDGSAPATLRLPFRSCARAAARPTPSRKPIRPPGFTG